MRVTRGESRAWRAGGLETCTPGSARGAQKPPAARQAGAVLLLYLSEVSGRALRGLDGCRKDRGRSDRTHRAGMQWRAATADFVRGRGMAAQPPGVRKSAVAVAGRRSRRSRSAVRHASSSPREGRPVANIERSPNGGGSSASHAGDHRERVIRCRRPPKDTCADNPNAGPRATTEFASGRRELHLRRRSTPPRCCARPGRSARRARANLPCPASRGMAVARTGAYDTDYAPGGCERHQPRPARPRQWHGVL